MLRFALRLRSRLNRTNWISCRDIDLNLNVCSMHQDLRKNNMNASPLLLKFTSYRQLTTSLVTFRDKSDYEKLEILKKRRLKMNEPKTGVIFKCKICGTRNVQSFSTKSYEEGVVVVKCSNCNNNRIITDNLGWFKDLQGRSIKDVLESKGEDAIRASPIHLPPDLMKRFGKSSPNGKEMSTKEKPAEDVRVSVDQEAEEVKISEEKMFRNSPSNGKEDSAKAIPSENVSLPEGEKAEQVDNFEKNKMKSEKEKTHDS